MNRDIPTDLPETLALLDHDPRRPALEAALRDADMATVTALWQRTRAAAAAARRQGEIDKVIVLIRGAKTIQRIADERGVILVSGLRR